MCGIAGIISLERPLPHDLIHTMCNTLGHRGPDDEGYIGVDLVGRSLDLFHGLKSQVRNGSDIAAFPHSKATMFLGHRRLSIIDKSPAGHQPMEYASGRLWIVFNGEIFNYKELRDELKTKGYAFHTNSDTEVILAAYEAWGEKCVSRFIGDWAFVLYDRREETLFLSRDRFGIKPLYYYYDPSSRFFAFASEVKALLSLPNVMTETDRDRCFEFLVFGIQEHSTETFYKNISQIGPGFNCSLDLETLHLTHQQYYDVHYTTSIGHYSHASALRYADDIRELLVDSIRLRLRADVPIGTSLSGGIDSSSIVVIINRLLKEQGTFSEVIGERQKTFTVSYPGEVVDETRFARLVATHIGADASFISPTLQDLRKEIKELLWFQDEPVGGASQYVQWKIMEKACSHVKVILDGQGGDEVFGGYSLYKSAYVSQLLKRLQLVKLARELIGTFTKTFSLKKMLSELKTLPMHLTPERLKPSLYLTMKRDTMDKCVRDLNMDLEKVPFDFPYSFTADLNEILYLYLMKYSLPHLLHYEDRNSMAFSIESRTPFTDHRLVDYLFSIPACYKFRNGWSKWLLRLAMRDLLPQEILWRKDKLGFAPSVTMKEYNRERIFSIWYKSIPRVSPSAQAKVPLAKDVPHIQSCRACVELRPFSS